MGPSLQVVKDRWGVVSNDQRLIQSQGNVAFPNADGGPEKKSMEGFKVFIEVHQVLAGFNRFESLCGKRNFEKE